MNELVEILNLPSPLTKIETSWIKESEVEVWLKRDDLIHPLISGNKWRKLSGVFDKWLSPEVSGITTYGGAYSNHLVATAVACSEIGIPSTGIIRGEEPKSLSPVLELCTAYEMKLEFISRSDYKSQNRKYGVFDNELFIPEGGACKEGTEGCSQILEEESIEQFSKVVVSCGTGTTLAGMYNYLKSNQKNAQLLCGIQVLKGDLYIQEELKNRFGITDAQVYDEFHCGGYAKTTDELIQFIKSFAAETGVLLDPIYTGKMMLAIKKLIESGELSSGQKILAIHTGGLTGWLGKTDELFKH